MLCQILGKGKMNEIRELTSLEVDLVSGGFAFVPVIVAIVVVDVALIAFTVGVVDGMNAGSDSNSDSCSD